MPWFVLFLSAGLEAVWATALGRSDGFTNPTPSVVFLVALAASMVTLAYAARSIPIGIAYAVWAGSGAVLTAGWAIRTGEETASVAKVVLLAGIVICIVGLKVVKSPPRPSAAAPGGDRRHDSDMESTSTGYEASGGGVDLSGASPGSPEARQASPRAQRRELRLEKKAELKRVKKEQAAKKQPSAAMSDALGFGMMMDMFNSDAGGGASRDQGRAKRPGDDSKRPRS